MLTIGIDAGIENIKAAVLRDGEIIGRARGRSGGMKRLEHAEDIVREALKLARLAPETKADRVFVTGKGRFDLASIADDVLTEPVTAAKAAEFLCPRARRVVVTGADETMALTLNDAAGIEEMVVNEKCAAGPGSFIRNMARRLGLTLEEISGLTVSVGEGPAVSDGCVVFGELDALSLLNRGTPPRDVAKAAVATAVIRVCTVVNDITVPAPGGAALFGGLTNNAAFVGALKERTGIDFHIPADADCAGAIGAALYAAGWGRRQFR